jgi:hypothetical protein
VVAVDLNKTKQWALITITVELKEVHSEKLAIIGLMVLVLTMIPAMPVSATATVMHKATGGGTIERPVAAGLVTFAFTAQQVDEQGTAKGELVFKMRNPTTDIRINADIMYLAVEGNKAWMGSVITQSNSTFPFLLVGQSIVFEVQDNGEGSKATEPDKVSQPQAVSDPVYALDKPDLTTNPTYWIDWTNGNVQVK